MSSVKKKISGVFSEIFRFIDDLLSFNVEMSKFSMYPKFLRLEKQNKNKLRVRGEFLDIELEIKSGKVLYRKFDKTRNFNMDIQKYPDYGSCL